jgi:LDH2 family malate/lactate/ureidoglycolate dehydrogenase
MDKHVFAVDRLENFIQNVLTALDVTSDHARICSQRMVEADLRGMHGHGIFRLPPYCQRIEAGGYNLRPDIKIKRETPVSAVLDGDNGLGQVVVTQAVDLSIQKAKVSGMAWVGICNSNHAGAGGVYAALALPHDLIAMYMAIGNANHMPPWGGIDLLLSTNPIAFAIPTGEEPPIVLDMATTTASYGKVKVAAQKGQRLPIGWMVDHKGRSLTDPQRIEDGFLLPIGEHKGYGLNFVIGALAGVLNTAAFGSSVIDFNKDFSSPTNSGQVIFTMRPDLFRDLAEFKAEMDLRIREIRNSTPMEGAEPIRLPGEMALQRQRKMRSDGVPVARPVLMQLHEIAHRLGLPDRLDDAR